MTPQEAAALVPEPPAEREPVDILIVDDEPGNRETLADIFTEMGYRPDTAATGQQALEKVRDRFYNVAILDIRLPDMNGTELLSQLKELQPDTTCIMVTGYASLQTSIRATNAGAYAYIIKPLDIEQVSALLEQALAQQHLQFYNRRLLRQFQALSDVTDTALALLDLDSLLQSLLERLITAMNADTGAILLVDEASQRLEVRAAVGIDEAVERRFSLSLGEGFAGLVAQKQTPLLVVDVPSDPRVVNPYIRARGIRSMLGAPLRVQDRLIGVAHVDTLQPRQFNKEEVHLFDVLTTRAALLIENARLYERERRLHLEAEAMAERHRQIADKVSQLYAVSQALVQHMGMDERLRTLAGYLVEAMQVDRCVIWLVEGDTLVPQTLVGVPEGEQETWRQDRVEPEQIGPVLKSALRRNQIVVVEDAQVEGLVTVDLPHRWNMRSVLLLPMVLAGRPIGVAWLDQPGLRREFTSEQRRLAEAIAGQAAVAIENARAFEQERTVASTLQESFLPRRVDDPPGFEIQTKYAPAYQTAQIGGDYFDFIELEEGKLGVVMGDVCGKGVTAAVFTAMAKYELRAYAVEDSTPASVITRLNRSLYSQMSEDCMFITMVYGVLDIRTGEFRYVNAAHPHPLLYDPQRNDVLELPTTGGMVGALPNVPFQESRVRLAPGSILLLYTDGVTEARTGHEMLETQGVQELLRRASGCSASAVSELVFRRALEFSGGNLKDDVAIVAIRALPKDP